MPIALGRPTGEQAVRARGWPTSTAAVVLCYIALPNLPTLLSIWLLNAQQHGYVNLESLLIGALGIFLPRWVVFFLLLLDSLADCAYSICYTYQFSLTDLLQSLRFVDDLPPERVIAGFAVAGSAALACWGLAQARPSPRRRLGTCGVLLALVAILLPVDILNGQNSLWHQDVSFFSFRVARSPVLVLAVRELSARSTESRARRAGDEPMQSASAGMMPLLGDPVHGGEPPNIVLVVVESWGLPLDLGLARAITAPYSDPAITGKYRVVNGTAPYPGLTVPGEARELCHSTMGFGILRLSSEQAQRCLPDQLRARGYESTAIHGYAGEMFYRAAWYRKVGFDRTWFAADLKGIGLPQCGGAFPGICDGAIANFIGSSLLSSKRPQPEFIYWVTLNSHLPVPARPALPDDNACAARAELRDSAALCSWFRLVRAVHQSVSRIATGALARPTIFVLVGDHAPPFGDPQLRGQFSATQVPYVMLVPLSASTR
jgi:hypothetical protein